MMLSAVWLCMKEMDPVGWATQDTRHTQSSQSSRPGSSHAQEMQARSSEEFAGAEFLEQAARDGLL